MHYASVFLLALAAVVAAEGQFYVPRAYYTIDAEGHPSPPVALRRLRRSYFPYPGAGAYPVDRNGGANANANANANAYGGGSANARADANANGRGGGWNLPYQGAYGSANPMRH